jgi:site-specific DNA recombinase
VCATYRKIKGGCSSHQIRNVVVEELLLDGIRRVTAFARDHEDEFVEMVTKKTRIDLDRSMRDGKRELEQSQAVSISWMTLSRGFMRTILRARFLMSVLPR